MSNFVYTIQYNLNGCLSNSAVSTVTVIPSPVLTTNNATICYGQSTTLNASSSIPGGVYSWTSGGSNLGSQNSLTVNPLSTTFYELVYTVNGCNDSVNILVDVIPITPVV